MLLKRYIYNLSTVPIYTPLTLNPLTWKIWWAPNNVSRWQMRFNSAFNRLNQLLGKSTRFVLAKKTLGDNMLCPTLQQALHIFFVTEIFWHFGIHTPTHHLRTLLPVPEDNLLFSDVHVLYKHCHILPNRNNQNRAVVNISIHGLTRCTNHLVTVFKDNMMMAYHNTNHLT